MNKIITSFGSAFIKPEEALYGDIIEFGKIIGSCGWTLYCGGHGGSMEAISKGVKSAGGKTIGVTVEEWTTPVNEYIDEIIKTPSLMHRIMKLTSIADAYIIFKGGTGTLVELSLTLELMNKKTMDEKPIIFYSDFWLGLTEILKLDSPALEKLVEKNVKFITSPKELLSIIN